MRRSSSHSGFSLLELSIVLVVLGLLTGGIFAGMSLFRSYEIKSILEQKEDYIITIGLFRQKYNALPGDFTRATQVWGTSPLCGGSGGEPYATCDGDGDNFIYGAEMFYIWNHLGNAGFMEKRYSLPANLTDPKEYYKPDVVVPGALNGEALWTLGYQGIVGDWYDRGYFYGSYGHVLMLANYDFDIPVVLTPREMVAFDGKVDDGLPTKGALVVPHGTYSSPHNPYNPYCTKKADGTMPTEADDLDALYAAAGEYGDEPACTVIFRNIF